jgi:hypothetical protein
MFGNLKFDDKWVYQTDCYLLLSARTTCSAEDRPSPRASGKDCPRHATLSAGDPRAVFSLSMVGELSKRLEPKSASYLEA